jgi:hypothetical protein
MTLGRNDPCPCGSGKKYKHCCLNAGTAQAAAPADLNWRRMRGLLDGFPDEMLRFTAQAYGPPAVHEAWDEFTGLDTLEFDSNTPLRGRHSVGTAAIKGEAARVFRVV